MRISDWSSDVCSSDLRLVTRDGVLRRWDGFVARGSGAAAAERLAQGNRLIAIDAALPDAEAQVEKAAAAVTAADEAHNGARRREGELRAALQQAEQAIQRAGLGFLPGLAVGMRLGDVGEIG